MRFLWLLLLLTACAGETGYDKSGPVPRLVYLPADSTEAQVSYLQTAAEAYHAVTGVDVFTVRMAADMAQTGCAIRVSWHDDLGGATMTDPETGLPRYYPRLGQLVTNPEQCHARLLLLKAAISDQTIVQHELGHSLGLKHSDNPADTMNAKRQLGQSLQGYVREHVAALQ